MRFWIFVLPLDVAKKDMKNGVIHQRKAGRLSKMDIGDKFIIYASKTATDGKKYQKIIAKGKVTHPVKKVNENHYQRKVVYYTMKEMPIMDVLMKFSFIKKMRSWGLYFIGGFREMTQDDYKLF
jgi:sialic acid synthase SpsE